MGPVKMLSGLWKLEHVAPHMQVLDNSLLWPIVMQNKRKSLPLPNRKESSTKKLCCSPGIRSNQMLLKRFNPNKDAVKASLKTCYRFKWNLKLVQCFVSSLYIPVLRNEIILLLQPNAHSRCCCYERLTEAAKTSREAFYIKFYIHSLLPFLSPYNVVQC